MTWGLGQIWRQGYNLGTLGRRPLDKNMQNLVTIGLIARYREISKVFPFKIMTPALGKIWPQCHNLKKPNKGPLGEATSQIWYL